MVPLKSLTDEVKAYFSVSVRRHRKTGEMFYFVEYLSSDDANQLSYACFRSFDSVMDFLKTNF